MPEPVDYSHYAGTVLFPRTPADLTSSTTCPACFTRLAGPTCPQCGLDVGSPLIAQLQSESTDAAAALARRFALIGRIRYESSLRIAVAEVPPEPNVVAELTPPPPPAAPVAPDPAAPPREPRRSSVQVILLVVGVSLLSVAAIFFLVYAFINFGIVWRSVIIAAITLAAFVAASLLRRRGLAATAEGIAVFGVVLVYLDAFAVRANDLFGAGDTDPLLYWGITLLVSAVAFYAWHRASSLRVASVAAFAAVAPGALLVVGSIDAGTSTPYLAFLAASAAGFVFPLTARLFERSLVLALSALSWVLAASVAFLVEPEIVWAPASAVVALALVATTYAIVARPTAWQRGWAVVGGVAAASSVAAGIVRSNDVALWTIAPALSAVIIALALDVVGRRTSRSVVAYAAAGAGVIAGVLLLPALVTAISSVFAALLRSPWSTATTARIVTPDATAILAIVTLAATVALVGGASVVARVHRPRILAWSTAATLVLAAPLAGTLLLIQVAWLLTAAAAVAALILTKRLRAPLAALAIASATLGYAVSWASETTWLAASLTVIVLLMVARLAVPAKPVLLAVTIAVAYIAAAALPVQFDAGDTRNSLHLVAAVGVLILFAPFQGTDRRVAFWASVPVIGITAVASQWALSLEVAPSQYVAALALAIGFVLALTVMIVRGSGFAIERIAASVILSVAVFWALHSAAHLLDVPDIARQSAPIAAALVVAATSLAGPLRLWRESGVAVVAVPAVVWTVTARQESGWFVLLLGAVTALLLALSRDGLVASSSPRKHLAWIALGLGTISLWWRLGTAGVEAMEAFVLPVAVVLLALAAALWRAKKQYSGTLLAGMLVATVPIAAAAATGSLVRVIVIGVVGGVLLVVGSLLVRPRSIADPSAIAGAAAVLTLSISRAAFAPDPDAPELDLWLAIAFVALAVVAWGQSRARDDATGLARTIVAQAAAITAMAAVLALELFALGSPVLGEVRVVTLVVVFGVVHAASRLLRRAPLSPAVGWTALAFASVVVIAGLVAGTLDPVEIATVPLAVALFVGAVRIERSSWVTIAPGLLVLLVPSLIATIGDRPGWRLLGIGVIAVAAIVYGTVRRLQAPFVLGTVIVLIHAAATFAPQIRLAYLALPWWLWAGFGGVALIVLAAGYEHRIKNLKDAVGRLSSMR